MRFLHTADWHLGRIFNAHSLIEDQAHLLREFVALVRDARPDAVLIAGDVYDRAVPPADAVALLDGTLSEIVLGLGVPVVMIAGNHDSGERLGFGAKLLAARGLHVAGSEPLTLRLADCAGDVDLIALPYLEPAVVRARFHSEEALDHAGAMRLQLDALRNRTEPARRSVLLAHAYVGGGEESESERPLSIGGSGAIPTEVFKGFDYVALGHLHQAQSLAAGRLRYSGSLMKYSLSEVTHAKSVSLVELDGAGSVSVETIALPPRRELRVLEGTLAELVELGRVDAHSEDYLHARLTDAGALLDPMAKLRETWPNALSLERLALSRSGEGGARRAALRQLDTANLFASFLREVADEEMDEARRAAFNEVLKGLDPEKRNG